MGETKRSTPEVLLRADAAPPSAIQETTPGLPSETRSGRDPAPSSLIPRQGVLKLGPYRILEKLGEGGMGAVYKAVHEHLEKVVAIKVLPAQLTRQADAVARFRQEMKAVGKVEHPHIVRAMDAGEVDGIHYLTMEYVDGIDLAHYVKTKGPMSVSNACKAIRQTAQGLAVAHAVGLVHRDIKPSNLLVTKSGQIKILDLGLARLATESARAGRELTAAGYTFGTPDFMAPEQWDDAHSVDGRADLYAVGCTLCFLLTGRAPFDTAEASGSLVKKMQAHVSWCPPNLRSLAPAVPESLAELFQRLLAKRPEDRVSTAAALAEAMLPWTRGVSATTLRDDGSDSEGKPPADVPEAKKDLSRLDLEFPKTLLREKLAERKRTQPAAKRNSPWLSVSVGGTVVAMIAAAALAIAFSHSDTQRDPTGVSSRVEIARPNPLPISAASTRQSPDLLPAAPGMEVSSTDEVAAVQEPKEDSAPPSAPKPVAPMIVVPSGPKTVQVGTGLGMVGTLKEALAQAVGGDTIEIATDEPLAISNRLVWNVPGRLTIRAAKDNRPVLVTVQEGAEAGTISFEALRSPTSKEDTVTLSGLTLLDLATKPMTAMIATSRSLAIRDCILVRFQAGGPPLWSREGVPDILLERCYLWRKGPVTTADIRSEHLTIRSCLFAGEGGIRLNNAKQQVLCEDTTFLRTNHAWEPVVEGTGNLEVNRSLFFGMPQVVTFRQASSKPSPAGMATARRQLGKYRGIDNDFFECERLCPNVSANAKLDLAAWQTFTGNGEKDPKFINPQFAHADLLAQVSERLYPPAAFAFKPQSPLVRAKIGCDVSLLPDIPPRAYELIPEAMRTNFKP